MKPVVALDMDELLFPLLDNLLAYVNQRDGSEWTTEHFYVYKPHVVMDISRRDVGETVLQFFQSLKDHPEPVSGSFDAVKKLEKDFELHVVTARENNLQTTTSEWLDHHFEGAFSQVHLCNLFAADESLVRTKGEVCDEIDAVALVDDSAYNLAEVVGPKRKGILFGNYRWNREVEQLPDGVTRAYTWPEVVDQLQEMAS